MAGDQEDLDVACLKSRSFPENDPIRVNLVSPLLAQEKEMDYLFGFSYVSDARSRDYTFNSVYLEPFPNNATRLIDVYETGTQDAQQHLLRSLLIPSCSLGGDFPSCPTTVSTVLARTSLTLTTGRGSATGR
jgi:tRNA nucleotidyltransferase/poly(A) polymerase